MLAPINIEDGDDEEVEALPEPLKARIKGAQLEDATAKRLISKLRTGDRRDHEITLAHATDREGILFIDNKL